MTLRTSAMDDNAFASSELKLMSSIEFTASASGEPKPEQQPQLDDTTGKKNVVDSDSDSDDGDQRNNSNSNSNSNSNINDNTSSSSSSNSSTIPGPTSTT